MLSFDNIAEPADSRKDDGPSVTRLNRSEETVKSSNCDPAIAIGGVRSNLKFVFIRNVG